MTALADKRTLMLAKSIVAAKEWPERPPNERKVKQRAKIISQEELLTTHRHQGLAHRKTALERELRTRGKSATTRKDVVVEYPSPRVEEERANLVDRYLSDVNNDGTATELGPPVMVISERLLAKPAWILRTEKFWWCGGPHKCAPRRRAPAQLRPTVYGFHSKKHVFGSAPTMSRVNMFERPSGTPPYKLAPPPSIGTSRRDLSVRGPDKNVSTRTVPESVSVLRPWLTVNLPHEATGVSSKACLVFLPCLTHSSFFTVAHPFQELPFIPPPQEAEQDLDFKAVLTPEMASPMPAEADIITVSASTVGLTSS